MTPKRIQRKRTKGWKMPENTVYVGRPTMWGNPFKLGDTVSAEQLGIIHPQSLKLDTIDKVLLAYQFWLDNSHKGFKIKSQLEELRNKDLACWCAPGSKCHADILLQLANH